MDKFYVDFESRQRIENFQVKIDFWLETILTRLGERPQADDIKDAFRRKKRASDFGVLFGRNHLYPLKLKIAALDKSISACISGRAMPPATSLSQMLVEVHQYVTNALAAYGTHMPVSVVMGLPDKLKILLKLAVELCSLYRRITIASTEDNVEGQKRSFDLIEDKCVVVLKEVEKLEAMTEAERQAKLKRLDALFAKPQPKTSKPSPYAPATIRRPTKPVAGSKSGPQRNDPRQRRLGASSLPNVVPSVQVDAAQAVSDVDVIITNPPNSVESLNTSEAPGPSGVLKKRDPSPTPGTSRDDSD